MVSQPAKAERGLAGTRAELRAVEAARRRRRVPRRLEGVDDGKHAFAPRAAGGFLELVRPPPVVGERRAAEEYRVVRGRLVREQDDDLSLHVDALVIVPGELGRGDAVAEEDGLGVELVEFLLRLAHAREALLAGDGERCLPLHGTQRRLRARDDAHEWDGLKVRAAFADRLEADLLVLGRDILRGEELAACTGAAPFQAVVASPGSRRRAFIRSAEISVAWSAAAPRDDDANNDAKRSRIKLYDTGCPYREIEAAAYPSVMRKP